MDKSFIHKTVEWINIERQRHYVDGYTVWLGGTFQDIGISVFKGEWF